MKYRLRDHITPNASITLSYVPAMIETIDRLHEALKKQEKIEWQGGTYRVMEVSAKVAHDGLRYDFYLVSTDNA